MFLKRVCLIAVILAVTSAAPSRLFRRVPMWYLPCGQFEYEDMNSLEESEEEISTRLDRIKVQYRLTLNNYLEQNYGSLYKKVRIGVLDHQYIPNWVPDRVDANTVRKLNDSSPQTIIDHFPQLHMNLQKFAVAFEQLIEDETEVERKHALKSTQKSLRNMLCEVESNINAISFIQLLGRVERNIMNDIERNPVDETRRLIRDWGVVLKYRDYLDAWRYVFKF
ncbi:uncharacterized protein [Linepithema humile]|uniref:uncharacterized protein n=1 Tax=Linepithema humile TaxID=83485 RepID=UPI0006233520|nr:PREDICTED: uncharacterized protein LOC105672254 [Linepithema humile]